MITITARSSMSVKPATSIWRIVADCSMDLVQLRQTCDGLRDPRAVQDASADLGFDQRTQASPINRLQGQITHGTEPPTRRWPTAPPCSTPTPSRNPVRAMSDRDAM